MDWTERRERLRALIAGPRCIYPGSVYDAISARIAEDLGFAAGMFAGSIASFAVLGAPDVVVLTLTEFAQQARPESRRGRSSTQWQVQSSCRCFSAAQARSFTISIISVRAMFVFACKVTCRSWPR